MPYTWSPESERALLLAAIQEANLKPSKEVWESVAAQLGGGLTAGAVSQKFNKIRNAATATGALGPSSAIKAKATKVPGSGTGGRKRKATNGENDKTVGEEMHNANGKKGMLATSGKEGSDANFKKVKIDKGESEGDGEVIEAINSEVRIDDED